MKSSIKLFLRVLSFVCNPIKRLSYYAVYHKALQRIALHGDRRSSCIFTAINSVLLYNFLHFLYLILAGRSLDDFGRDLHCDSLYMLISKPAINLFGVSVNFSVILYNWNLFKCPRLFKLNDRLSTVLLDGQLPGTFHKAKYRKQYIVAYVERFFLFILNVFHSLTLIIGKSGVFLHFYVS